MIDFTHESYRGLIRFLTNDLGYSVGPFRDFPDTGNATILRHDIDFSISKALEMARLEAGLGVSSTYFVLLSAPFYNALEKNNVRMLREILQLGGELGLHYDASPFGDMDVEQVNEHIRNQVQMLEIVTETKITSISQHKPASSKIRPQIAEYTDAYDDKYVRRIGYLSDSRKYFGAPDVHGFFRDIHKRSQLLIHPIWWNETDLPIGTIFSNLRLEMDDFSRGEFDVFNRNIQAYFRDKSHEQGEKNPAGCRRV